jgi:hypothetical protein
MIKRMWRGWATKENTNSYFDVLTNKVIPGIEAKNIPDYKGFEELRKDKALSNMKWVVRHEVAG